jgi:hypothetical protein
VEALALGVGRVGHDGVAAAVQPRVLFLQKIEAGEVVRPKSRPSYGYRFFGVVTDELILIAYAESSRCRNWCSRLYIYIY